MTGKLSKMLSYEKESSIINKKCSKFRETTTIRVIYKIVDMTFSVLKAQCLTTSGLKGGSGVRTPPPKIWKVYTFSVTFL